ncbi:MAG: hypothetical protein HY332_08395 [Chloroflexi bacterium]|nr:hypothetical protein [Chloroflexota bacterium]
MSRLPGFVVPSPRGLARARAAAKRRSMVAALTPAGSARTAGGSRRAPAASSAGTSSGRIATRRFPQSHPVASAATCNAAVTAGPWRSTHRAYVRCYPVKATNSFANCPFPRRSTRR